MALRGALVSHDKWRRCILNGFGALATLTRSPGAGWSSSLDLSSPGSAVGAAGTFGLPGFYGQVQCERTEMKVFKIGFCKVCEAGEKKNKDNVEVHERGKEIEMGINVESVGLRVRFWTRQSERG